MIEHPRKLGLFVLIVGLSIGSVMAGCTSDGSEPDIDEAPAEIITEADVAEPVVAEPLEGDAVRGGQLYDSWWAVIEAPAPASDQPLWATQSSNARAGADTWRCKECHGWDYQGVDGAYGSGSHMTGFAGVLASREKPAEELLTALQGGTSADHDFSTLLDEQDLVDLTLFMTEAVIDDGGLIGPEKVSKGDATVGAERYAESCEACHGPEGNAIDFGGLDEHEFVGHIASGNPWEFIHKVRFGQPGWPMPSALSDGWSDFDVADVLAHAQSLSTEPAVSGGGLLYDKWWAVLGADAPTEDHPLWSTQSSNTRSGADTWRCKECHGWDYEGVDGAYGSGSHMTGFAGVLGAMPDGLLGWLDGTESADHDFSSVMDETALTALVTFMGQEMADISAYVDADGLALGDPANGREMYNDTCASCHDVDGTMRNFGDEEEPEYVGTIAVDNPWEFMHKVYFGQPGEPMPIGSAMGWTLDELADILAYAQTLPTE